MNTPPNPRDDLIFGSIFGAIGLALAITLYSATKGISRRVSRTGNPVAAAILALPLLAIIVHWIASYRKKRNASLEWVQPPSMPDEEPEERPPMPSLGVLIENIVMLLLAYAILFLTCLPAQPK